MGNKMPDSSPPEESSPAREDDIDLPDAPPVPDKSEALNTISQEDGNTNAHSKADVRLEDLFDQDDDDDEFSTSSSAIPSSPPSQPTSSMQPRPSAPTESYSDPSLMLQFYSRLFPFRALFHWLNHSPKPGPDFAHREFAFTLSNDAYLRYQSYPSADLLKRDILRLNPSRFEIGPIYTTNPRDRKTLRKSSAFKALSKEIVFDIDLTDYDDIRTCCDKANICPKCWTFATMAIKVIDVALRDDFGFEHILWVYSGRRGVHAWISDKDARELDDDKRKAITGYFEVIKGGVQGGRRVNVKRPLHPHLVRSLEILKPYFQSSILVDQEPFLSQAGQDRLLQLLPDKALNDALRKKWSSSPDRPSVRKWADIDALAATGVSNTLDTKALMEAKQEILLEYTYPRLDVEVGKKRNHLLKSPFVVHPGTGRVCVPITGDAEHGMAEVEHFDPFSVPKVTELLTEVDSYGKSKNAEGNGEAEDRVEDGFVEDGVTMRKVQDWEKTRLKPYVECFEGYVRRLLKSEARVKREREENGMEF
jgi:DNA primase small subunit